MMYRNNNPVCGLPVVVFSAMVFLGLIGSSGTVAAWQSQAAADDPFTSSLGNIEPSWYDKSTDSTKWPGPQPEEKAVSSDRASIPVIPMTQRTNPGMPNVNFDWLGPGISWVVLGLLFLVLMGLVIWVLMKINPDQSVVVRVANVDDGNRIENLPFEMDRTIRDFREAALAAANEKNFRQAIIYLYSHALVMLDRREVIQLRKGKTNRQYLGELLRRVPGASAFRILINDFESVFFGDYPALEQDYQRVLSNTDSIDRLAVQADAGGNL